MKMTDNEIRQAVEHRLSALDCDPSRRARILRRIEKEGEPQVKKKLSVGLVFAIVLLLALAGVALALTTNLFAFFGQRDERYEKVADQAALETSAPVTVMDEQTGAVDARFDSAFYDGMTLNVAISVDRPSRVEPYTPDGDALSSMEVAEDMPLIVSEAGDEEKTDAQLALQAAMEAGTPYGYQIVEYYPSDHVLTDDGIDIPPYAGDSTVDENGRYVEMREFESPLPEELQNLDAITLNCTVYRSVQRWYFDGTTLYDQSASEQVGAIHATVPRSDGMTLTMQGTYAVGGAEYAVTAQVSTMSAVVTLDGDGSATLRDLLGNADEIPAGIDPADVWVNMTAYDEQGRAYVSEGGFGLDQTLPLTEVFMGVGELPKSLEVQVFIDWEGDAGDGAQPLVIALSPTE